MHPTHRAPIILVAGASCAGKDTIVSRLLTMRPEIHKLITTTTRPPRPGEEDGSHYHFLSEDSFLRLVQQGGFLEHAVVHGHHYGLTYTELGRVRSLGGVPLAILDTQGVQSVARKTSAVRVFVTAPIDQIEKRLRRVRPKNEINTRLENAKQELLEAAGYDIVLVNADGLLDQAVAELLAFYDQKIRPRLWSLAKSKTKPRPGPIL